MRIEMQWEDTTRKLALRLAPGARMLRANPMTIAIKMADSDRTRTVNFTGDPLSVTL
jgi:hypothetical protein